MGWQQGMYAQLRKEGKTVRRHPDGKDPLKKSMFGEIKRCSKCFEDKSIFNFHWKTDLRNGVQRRRLQAECGECRALQRATKYSSHPRTFVERAIQLTMQESTRYKHRKPCTLTKDQFLGEWDTQYEKTGLICPLSGQEMTYLQGHGDIDTNISIDRIDNSKIYEKGNIQFVCRRINLMKAHYSNDDLIFWAKAIVRTNESE